jgi:hypothetical protein
MENQKKYHKKQCSANDSEILKRIYDSISLLLENISKVAILSTPSAKSNLRHSDKTTIRLQTDETKTTQTLIIQRR